MPVLWMGVCAAPTYLDQALLAFVEGFFGGIAGIGAVAPRMGPTSPAPATVHPSGSSVRPPAGAADLGEAGG